MSKQRSRHKRREVETGMLERNIERCPETGKIIHRTRRKALRDNGKLANRGFRAGDAYVCRFCGWWHLTTPR